jgi:hypothetical protein
MFSIWTVTSSWRAYLEATRKEVRVVDVKMTVEPFVHGIAPSTLILNVSITAILDGTQKILLSVDEKEYLDAGKDQIRVLVGKSALIWVYPSDPDHFSFENKPPIFGSFVLLAFGLTFFLFPPAIVVLTYRC